MVTHADLLSSEAGIHRVAAPLSCADSRSSRSTPLLPRSNAVMARGAPAQLGRIHLHNTDHIGRATWSPRCAFPGTLQSTQSAGTFSVVFESFAVADLQGGRRFNEQDAGVSSRDIPDSGGGGRSGRRQDMDWPEGPASQSCRLRTRAQLPARVGPRPSGMVAAAGSVRGDGGRGSLPVVARIRSFHLETPSAISRRTV